MEVIVGEGGSGLSKAIEEHIQVSEDKLQVREGRGEGGDLGITT